MLSAGAGLDTITIEIGIGDICCLADHQAAGLQPQGPRRYGWYVRLGQESPLPMLFFPNQRGGRLNNHIVGSLWDLRVLQQ